MGVDTSSLLIKAFILNHKMGSCLRHSGRFDSIFNIVFAYVCVITELQRISYQIDNVSIYLPNCFNNICWDEDFSKDALTECSEEN